MNVQIRKPKSGTQTTERNDLRDDARPVPASPPGASCAHAAPPSSGRPAGALPNSRGATEPARASAASTTTTAASGSIVAIQPIAEEAAQASDP